MKNRPTIGDGARRHSLPLPAISLVFNHTPTVSDETGRHALPPLGVLGHHPLRNAHGPAILQFPRLYPIAAMLLLMIACGQAAAPSDGITLSSGEKRAVPSGFDRVKTGSFVAGDIVAAVGPWTITAADLMDSYAFGPAFVKRMKDPLYRHLEFMVFERLMAADGLKRRRDTTAFVRERLSALSEDNAIDRLLNDEAASRMHVTDAEIEEAARKASVSVRVSWIVRRSQAEADSLYAACRRSGAAEEALFAGTDRLPGRTMETTLLELERFKREIVRQIGSLHAHALSRPVRGYDGYYLFRVENLGRSALSAATDAAAARAKAVRLLRIQKAESLGSEYASRLMKRVKPVIKAEGFNIARAVLVEQHFIPDTLRTWEMPATFLTEEGRVPLPQASEFLSSPLVAYGRAVITVGEYLQWFEIRQLEVKTHSFDAFNESVKRTIWKMTQDRLLSEEAYARGLRMDDSLRHDMEQWKAKYLYMENRMSLMRSAIPAESKQMLTRTIGRLEQEIPVSIAREKVAQLQAIMDTAPRPVPILDYTLRGTFRRTAVPTIDPAWQEY